MPQITRYKPTAYLKSFGQTKTKAPTTIAKIAEICNVIAIAILDIELGSI